MSDLSKWLHERVNGDRRREPPGSEMPSRRLAKQGNGVRIRLHWRSRADPRKLHPNQYSRPVSNPTPMPSIPDILADGRPRLSRPTLPCLRIVGVRQYIASSASRESPSTRHRRVRPQYRGSAEPHPWRSPLRPTRRRNFGRSINAEAVGRLTAAIPSSAVACCSGTLPLPQSGVEDECAGDETAQETRRVWMVQSHGR